MNSNENARGKGLGGLGLLSAAKVDKSGTTPSSFGLIGPQGGLIGLLGKPEVRNIYYTEKLVVLDGYTFIGCRFDNCKLQVSTTNFDLVDCVIDPSTTIVYGESVTRIIRLFLSRFDWAYQQFNEFFVPKRNPNGSMTISRET
jgi:hypothetical protein